MGRTADDVLQLTAPYVRVQGLTIDGAGTADTGIKCTGGAHHIWVVGNRICDLGVGGVVAHGCDYVVVRRNQIWHVGYGKGWGSGISIHEARWHDHAGGFHSLVVGNVVSGSTDDSFHHTDGNGIILDLAADPRAGTPPVLVANNVVFMNGGRCIETYHATGAWIVNDTCYRNALDLRVGRGCRCIGEVAVKRSRDVHVVNTLAAAWTGGVPFVTPRLDPGHVRPRRPRRPGALRRPAGRLGRRPAAAAHRADAGGGRGRPVARGGQPAARRRPRPADAAGPRPGPAGDHRVGPGDRRRRGPSPPGPRLRHRGLRDVDRRVVQAPTVEA